MFSVRTLHGICNTWRDVNVGDQPKKNLIVMMLYMATDCEVPRMKAEPTTKVFRLSIGSA